MPKNNKLTETERKFDNADELGIPPYNWVPPEVPQLEETVSQRSAYSTDLKEIRGQVGNPNFDPPPKGRQALVTRMRGKGLSIYPSRANFRHIDPEEFSKLEESLGASARKRTTSGAHAIKSLQQAPGQGGTLLLQSTARQQKVQQKLQEAEKQYERLKTAFKWIVCKIGERCSELNEAIISKQPLAYAQAREKYIALLRNLNIHNPKNSRANPQNDQIKPQDGFGYGGVLGWMFVDPVIQRKRGVNLITGVTIVGEWIGYHTSSSGIPIPD